MERSSEISGEETRPSQMTLDKELKAGSWFDGERAAHPPTSADTATFSEQSLRNKRLKEVEMVPFDDIPLQRAGSRDATNHNDTHTTTTRDERSSVYTPSIPEPGTAVEQSALRLSDKSPLKTSGERPSAIKHRTIDSSDEISSSSDRPENYGTGTGGTRDGMGTYKDFDRAGFDKVGFKGVDYVGKGQDRITHSQNTAAAGRPVEQHSVSFRKHVPVPKANNSLRDIQIVGIGSVQPKPLRVNSGGRRLRGRQRSNTICSEEELYSLSPVMGATRNRRYNTMKERDRQVFNSLGRKEGPRFLSKASSSNPPGLFDSWTSSLSTLANTVVAVGTGGALEAEPNDSSGPNPRAGENGPNFGTVGGGGGDSLRRASVGEYESDTEHTSEYTDEDSVFMDEDYQRPHQGTDVMSIFAGNTLVIVMCLTIHLNYVLLSPYLTPVLWAVFASFALKGVQIQVVAKLGEWLSEDTGETRASDLTQPPANAKASTGDGKKSWFFMMATWTLTLVVDVLTFGEYLAMPIVRLLQSKPDSENVPKKSSSKSGLAHSLTSPNRFVEGRHTVSYQKRSRSMHSAALRSSVTQFGNFGFRDRNRTSKRTTSGTDLYSVEDCLPQIDPDNSDPENAIGYTRSHEDLGTGPSSDSPAVDSTSLGLRKASLDTLAHKNNNRPDLKSFGLEMPQSGLSKKAIPSSLKPLADSNAARSASPTDIGCVTSAPPVIKIGENEHGNAARTLPSSPRNASPKMPTFSKLKETVGARIEHLTGIRTSVSTEMDDSSELPDEGGEDVDAPDATATPIRSNTSQKPQVPSDTSRVSPNTTPIPMHTDAHSSDMKRKRKSGMGGSNNISNGYQDLDLQLKLMEDEPIANIYFRLLFSAVSAYSLYLIMHNIDPYYALVVMIVLVVLVLILLVIVGALWLLWGVSKNITVNSWRRFDTYLGGWPTTIIEGIKHTVNTTILPVVRRMGGRLGEKFRAAARENVQEIATSLVILLIGLASITFFLFMSFQVMRESQNIVAHSMQAMDEAVEAHGGLVGLMGGRGKVRDAVQTGLLTGKEYIDQLAGKPGADEEESEWRKGLAFVVDGLNDVMNSTFSQQRAGQNALAFAGIQETLPATYHLIASLSRSKGDFNLGTIRDSLEEIQRLAWKKVNSMDIQSLKSAAIAIGQWYKNATTEIFQGFFETLYRFSSVLIGGLGAATSFMVSSSIFLAVFYYLLSVPAEPFTIILGVFPIHESTREKFSDAATESIRGIFVSTAKVFTFHVLFTWLTFSLYDLDFVYMCCLLSGIFSIVPFFSSWMVAVAGALQLLARGSTLSALWLFLMHYGLVWFVDPAIYGEIPSSHPYVTGMSIVMGLSRWGLQGALIGPVIVCIPVIMYQLYFDTHAQAKPHSPSYRPSASRHTTPMHTPKETPHRPTPNNGLTPNK